MSIQHLKDGIIVGMILGDGHLRSGTPSLRLLHTDKQGSYLKFKLSLAEQLGYDTKLYRNTIVKTNLGDHCYSTGIIRGSDISKYYRIPRLEMLDMLNDLGLLLWWLDDGCLSIHEKQNGSISRFGYLNTQAFGLEGNEIISYKLERNFNIITNIHRDTKSGFAKSDHFRLYLNASNMRRLIDIVRDYITWIPKDHRYKLDMKYVINRRSDSIYFAENYNF